MKKLNILFAFIAVCLSAFSQAPTITSFSPASGPVGTLVTITGTNLSSPTAFTIGGVSAIVVSDNSTTLVGMVMPGAATGAVSVTTAGGTATSGSSFTITPTGYPRYQHGIKLVGIGGDTAYQGSVAISADGNTAIVGGMFDSNQAGATWMYTRSGSTWTQQGGKLVGTGAVGKANQGNSVALSADGNTAIIGGGADNNDTGAAWIYTRSAGIWTQQGSKLVGTGAEGSAILQGNSVALSADGNTAIMGGPGDSTNRGAVWIFTRSGSTWSQQGTKLVGTGAVNSAFGISQGYSVALSADGNTAILGGYDDNNEMGATWIFTRTGSTWTQQGSKLVGTGVAGFSGQGSCVALSADGNTAIVGGMYDSTQIGATWIFNRSGTTWTQQGNKLVGTGVVGAAQQGASVTISADGNTSIIGGPNDDLNLGAVWIFTRSGNSWTQRGSKLVGTGGVGSSLQGASVALSANGYTAIIGGPGDNSQIGAAWVFVTCQGINSSVITQRICQGDTFIFGSQYLTASGIYTNTLTNMSGCDSIITLTLTVDTVTAYFTLIPTNTPHYRDIVDECTGNDLSYIWNWGDSTANSIGDTASHTYAAAGYYNVCVTISDSIGCTAQYCDTNVYLFKDQSGQMVYVNVVNYPSGINQINSTSPIHIYPNPNKGSFTLETSGSMGSDYTISDMLGHVFIQESIRSDKETIELSDAAEGVYTLMVKGQQPIRFAVLR